MFIPAKAKEEPTAAAKREGCSLRDYFLAGAYERLRRKPVMKPDEYREIIELHEQLRRAGISLNSLLRPGFLSDISNRRRPTESEFRDVLDELNDAVRKITEAVDQFREWAGWRPDIFLTNTNVSNW